MTDSEEAYSTWNDAWKELLVVEMFFFFNIKLFDKNVLWLRNRCKENPGFVMLLDCHIPENMFLFQK